ncbi:IS5 family transposase IS493 [Streptomyces atroolivaceus]
MILDGTVLPIDRITADRPYYSGKKKHHGMNVQIHADAAGGLIWVSDALPGATHDLTAAQTHGIPVALDANDSKCWADKAYQGAGPAIRVPMRGKHLTHSSGAITVNFGMNG